MLDSDAPAASAWWGVTAGGNFEGANILHRPIRGDIRRPEYIERARRRLLEVRNRRVRPGLDDKVLTEWNALFVATLAEAGAAAGDARWLDAAVVTAEFLLWWTKAQGGNVPLLTTGPGTDPVPGALGQPNTVVLLSTRDLEDNFRPGARCLLAASEVHPDVNWVGAETGGLLETLLYLLYQAAGRAPAIPLDERLRPTWLFGQTVHEGCDRGGYYEQADFADGYGSPRCIVRLGCWGPVVQCNVGKRGWIGGIGGCPNVGGVCIGCTMPGFPDKFMPFMDMPPGAHLSSTAVVLYGKTVRALRKFTQASLNQEPAWRRR